MDSELFKYFVEQTNGRLDKVDAQLTDLKSFKVEMVVSARTTSLIIGAVCGATTLVATVALVYFTARHGG